MISGVPFFKREYSEETETKLVEVLRSGFLTSGKIGMGVETLLESYFDISGAALTSSWTNGAVVALSCLKISSGDEVIVPAITFIATSSVVKSVGAIPIICDVSLLSGNVDWKFIEPKITERTKAVFVVHMYGLMVDVKDIRERLDSIGRQDIYILEDAAHCFEGELDGYKPGKYSTCAIFSFYATKNISCGEGGAIISSDKEFIDLCKISRLHGMTGSAYDRYTSKKFNHYDVKEFAHKANLPDLLASMLPEQIKSCDEVLVLRELAANTYIEQLQSLLGNKIIELQVYDEKKVKHARHLFPILLKDYPRDEVIDHLNASGIGVAVNFRSLTQLSVHENQHSHNAEIWGASCISLPFFPGISEKEIKYVVGNLLHYLENRRPVKCQ